MNFSKLKHAFYADDLLGDYRAAGTLPEDIAPISDSDYAAIFAGLKNGKVIDWSGTVPVAIDPPAAPAAIPSSVSPAQARLALLSAGRLAQVEAIVSNADAATQIAWNNASVIERSSPTVAALSAALGLDSTQLDALFTAAAAIRV